MVISIAPAHLLKPGDSGYEEQQRMLMERELMWVFLEILDWPILIPIIGLFLDLIWLYFLSCLIVWIYDKYKKKK
jgi:hypothetical protein